MFELPKFNRAMEEFHDLCTQYHIEAKIEALPNPSNLGMLRVITFQSFGDDSIKIVRQYGETAILPSRGTVQIMLDEHEQLPNQFERIN